MPLLKVDSDGRFNKMQMKSARTVAERVSRVLKRDARVRDGKSKGHEERQLLTCAPYYYERTVSIGCVPMQLLC